MALEYYDWDVNGVTVLHLLGPITLGQATSKFRELIHGLVDTDKKNIVLNLVDVPYMDSAGIGELVGAYTTVTRRGGMLKLMKLTRRVQDVVHVTKIYRIFEVFNDEDTAVQSFNPVSQTSGT